MTANEPGNFQVLGVVLKVKHSALPLRSSNFMKKRDINKYYMIQYAMKVHESTTNRKKEKTQKTIFTLRSEGFQGR